MTQYQEKVFFGVSALLAAGFSHVGAVFSHGDARWFLVTISVSLITSAVLSLMFKKPDETMQLVASRCGVAILGGVFLTKYIAWQFAITVIDDDVVAFGGLAVAVTTGTFIVGYKALRILEHRSEYLAGKFVDISLKKHIGTTGRPDAE